MVVVKITKVTYFQIKNSKLFYNSINQKEGVQYVGHPLLI